MTREGRTVAIAGLTFFMFALFIFMEHGTFVFPFPLNEFVVFIVSFLFTIWHPRKGILPYLLLASALIGILGTQFLWEIFFSIPELESFFSYPVVDWVRLSSSLFLIAAILIFTKTYRPWFLKTIGFFCAGLYVWGIAFNQLEVQCLAFLGLSLLGGIYPIRKPFHLIWLLYFLLLAMKWMTLTFI